MKTAFAINVLIVSLASAVAFQAADAASLCLSAKDGLDKMCARDVAQDSTCVQGGDSSDKVFAWIGDSCVNPTGNEVIPEIVALEDGASIPSAAFHKYTPDEIAISLNYRYFQKKVRPGIKPEDIEKPAYDFYRNVVPMMAFNVAYLKSIIQYGFLNQHQLTHSKGDQDRALRSQVEDALITVRVEKEYGDNERRPENYLRPKYSFASFYEPVQNMQPNFDTRYGSVYAVFDNDLKKRAFFTNGDALVHYNGGLDIAPKTYYDLSHDFEYSTRDLYESQIWGRLDFSRVRYLLVNCPDVNETADDVVQALKDVGSQVPVFTCKKEIGTDTFFRLVPDKQIYGHRLALATLAIPNLIVPPRIHVITASFGHNIADVPEGNATDDASTYCNGKPTCQFKVSTRFLEDPAPHKKKAFSITWACREDGTGPTFTHNLSAAHAMGATITLSCH